MPIVLKMKQRFIRRLRRTRTDFRKWAQHVDPNVAFQVEHIFCAISRLIQREPHNLEHQYRAAMCVMKIAAAHGAYKAWAAA